jgi:hypothetical protein
MATKLGYLLDISGVVRKSFESNLENPTVSKQILGHTNRAAVIRYAIRLICIQDSIIEQLAF